MYEIVHWGIVFSAAKHAEKSTTGEGSRGVDSRSGQSQSFEEAGQ